MNAKDSKTEGDVDEFSRKLEEHKELGQEVRYRDQFMAQEFGLSMVATGLVLNASVQNIPPLVSIALQVFAFLFLSLLLLHLRNTNQDRISAFQRKEILRDELEFAAIHNNPTGRERMSSSFWMMAFVCALATGWAIWTLLSICKYFRPDIFHW